MYNISICPEGVRKTMQVFSKNSRYKSQDFNNFAVKFRNICTIQYSEIRQDQKTEEVLTDRLVPSVKCVVEAIYLVNWRISTNHKV
jgi:hypothetical protein